MQPDHLLQIESLSSSPPSIHSVPSPALSSTQSPKKYQKPGKRLVIATDFDCTLTYQHFFKLLHGYNYFETENTKTEFYKRYFRKKHGLSTYTETQENLKVLRTKKNSTKFLREIFGFPERENVIRRFLELSLIGDIYIVTLGVVDEVISALEVLGLKRYVKGIAGYASYERNKHHYMFVEDLSTYKSSYDNTKRYEVKSSYSQKFSLINDVLINEMGYKYVVAVDDVLEPGNPARNYLGSIDTPADGDLLTIGLSYEGEGISESDVLSIRNKCHEWGLLTEEEKN